MPNSISVPNSTFLNFTVISSCAQLSMMWINICYSWRFLWR